MIYIFRNYFCIKNLVCKTVKKYSKPSINMVCPLAYLQPVIRKIALQFLFCGYILVWDLEFFLFEKYISKQN